MQNKLIIFAFTLKSISLQVQWVNNPLTFLAVIRAHKSKCVVKREVSSVIC